MFKGESKAKHKENCAYSCKGGAIKSQSKHTHKMKHTPARETSCKRKPAETKIPEPLTTFPHGICIYKLYDNKYWQATILRYNTHKG